jgi:hypothetical protein
MPGGVVQGEDEVGSDLRKLRVGDHGGCARPSFLRRLEEEDDAPRFRPHAAEAAPKRRENRHMPVMTAQMGLTHHL